MIVDIYCFNQCAANNKIIHSLTPDHLGYAEVETFNAEEIFHLCNWGYWAKEKPSNLHANIDSCGHGLYLENPETKDIWLSKSRGWLVGDADTISKYVFRNKHKVVWL